MPTPLRFVNAARACSTLGSFRKALRVSAWTAFGVLIRTKFVNCGKNFPRCSIKKENRMERKKRAELKAVKV